tara:strand:+ start:987 stop:2081 length:1095 start_codon:yes stop_codon:yes gene_type:complete
MKAGIIGLPNVGKSTLFNCLSSAKAQSANFPFCTIEPNIGVINVPDDRLDYLSKLVSPEKVIPATVEIVDIAGLVKGASRGEGLGNQFLGNIRETDAIIHLIRCFNDDNIIHVDGNVNPIRDKETIDMELQLKDLETVKKRKEKIIRAAKTGNKEALKELDVIEEIIISLESAVNVRSLSFNKSDREAYVNRMQLITDKPVLYICNVGEKDAVDGNTYVEQIKDVVAHENADVLVLAVSIESDINELESYEERSLFLEDLGLSEPGSAKLIRSVYSLLSLQTFFTAGKNEVRAWTIKKGASAPKAAGVIHTDFEKGFIRAEVIAFKDYKFHGSEQKVKEAGKMRIEGKEYTVQDGDVIHFRFNV